MREGDKDRKRFIEHYNVTRIPARWARVRSSGFPLIFYFVLLTI